MRATCSDCHEEFDDAQPGTWRQVTGWVVDRSGGGANAVRQKRETGLVRCPPCGKLRDLGATPNGPTQESLGL